MTVDAITINGVVYGALSPMQMRIADLEQALAERDKPTCPECGSHNAMPDVVSHTIQYGDLGTITYDAPIYQCGECAGQWAGAEDEDAQAQAIIKCLHEKLAETKGELDATSCDRDSWRDQARTNRISEVHLRDALAERTSERDALQTFRARVQERVAPDNDRADDDILLARIDDLDHVDEAARLLVERDALAAIVQRLYPYMERVSHIHLPDGSLLQASEVWDALNKPTEYLSARLAAERKAGKIEALQYVGAQFDPGGKADQRYGDWMSSDVATWLDDVREQIEKGEVGV